MDLWPRQIHTVEDHKFLDTTHMHAHVVTIHEEKPDYNDGTYHACMTCKLCTVCIMLFM